MNDVYTLDKGAVMQAAATGISETVNDVLGKSTPITVIPGAVMDIIMAMQVLEDVDPVETNAIDDQFISEIANQIGEDMAIEAMYNAGTRICNLIDTTYNTDLNNGYRGIVHYGLGWADAVFVVAEHEV